VPAPGDLIAYTSSFGSVIFGILVYVSLDFEGYGRLKPAWNVLMLTSDDKLFELIIHESTMNITWRAITGSHSEPDIDDVL